MKRVLVVEPHPQVLDALADLVEEEPGLELAGAVGTAREAIALARSARPDVVLVDVDEPSWRAERLDHQLSELLPRALLIRLSAATDLEQESLKSPENTSPSILKTAIPAFLRSLTA
jgi:DNA-binding NarL/FixJ family response regulator